MFLRKNTEKKHKECVPENEVDAWGYQSAPGNRELYNNEENDADDNISDYSSENENTIAWKIRLFFDEIKSIAITILFTWFILNFVIINANIPSQSMENTIMTGDRIVGLRFLKDYKRGDIVIFPDPEENGRYLIKRIIGLPGETLEIRETEPGSGIACVYINGEKLMENYLAEPMLYTGDLTVKITGDGYFMMGDNRNYSFDARYWDRKVIYKNEIIGVAKFRYWPITEAGVLKP